MIKNLKLPLSSRNPDGDDKPWCHVVKNLKLTWEYCDIPQCCKGQPLATSFCPHSLPFLWTIFSAFSCVFTAVWFRLCSYPIFRRSGLGGEGILMTEAVVGWQCSWAWIHVPHMGNCLRIDCYCSVPVNTEISQNIPQGTESLIGQIRHKLPVNSQPRICMVNAQCQYQ